MSRWIWIAILFFIGCTASAPSVTGLWYDEKQPEAVRLDFREDGQIILGVRILVRLGDKIIGNSEWSHTVVGRWKQEGNTIIITPSGARWIITDGVIAATTSEGKPLRYIRKAP